MKKAKKRKAKSKSGRKQIRVRTTNYLEKINMQTKPYPPRMETKTA